MTEGYSEAFDRLKRAELARLASDTRPVMVSIGGQPGAGKSRAIARIRRVIAPTSLSWPSRKHFHGKDV